MGGGGGVERGEKEGGEGEGESGGESGGERESKRPLERGRTQILYFTRTRARERGGWQREKANSFPTDKQ